MGLFYRMFNDSMISKYNENKQMFTSFDDFLSSPLVKEIYEEYEIHEGSLHWALNVSEIFRIIGENPVVYKERIEKPIIENEQDWENNKRS